MSNPSDRPLPRHGGDLDFPTARYGTPSEGWLDLSTGVNPHPYPAADIPASTLTSLPGDAALAKLIAAARATYRAPAGLVLIATPGTDLAIRLLPSVAPAGAVAVIGPTYASHAEAWRNAGRAVSTAPDLSAAPPGAAVVVVVNPNNPDGRVSEPAVLRAVGERLARTGGLLVVDEAFADVAPAVSLLPHLDGLAAVVLRSFGKFYGLPGLRLGFAAGTPALISRLAALLGDWPVSAPAIAIGTAALSDHAWQAAMRTRLAAEMRHLRSLLARHDRAIRGGTDLFVLVDDPNAAGLHEHLARLDIWTRTFAEQPTWLRLGLPGSDAHLDRLDRALSRA